MAPANAIQSTHWAKMIFACGLCRHGLLITNISLAQEKVGDKTNEITVVPKLLSAIDLKDTIVTIDAMGCQTSITKKIREGNGDYIIALKKNQKTSYDFAKDIIAEYTDRDYQGIVSKHTSFDRGHGRLEERKCIVVVMAALLKKCSRTNLKG